MAQALEGTCPGFEYREVIDLLVDNEGHGTHVVTLSFSCYDAAVLPSASRHEFPVSSLIYNFSLCCRVTFTWGEMLLLDLFTIFHKMS